MKKKLLFGKNKDSDDDFDSDFDSDPFFKNDKDGGSGVTNGNNVNVKVNVKADDGSSVNINQHVNTGFGQNQSPTSQNSSDVKNFIRDLKESLGKDGKQTAQTSKSIDEFVQKMTEEPNNGQVTVSNTVTESIDLNGKNFAGVTIPTKDDGVTLSSSSVDSKDLQQKFAKNLPRTNCVAKDMEFPAVCDSDAKKQTVAQNTDETPVDADYPAERKISIDANAPDNGGGCRKRDEVSGGNKNIYRYYSTG